MSLKAFIAECIVTGGQTIREKALLVEGGRVKALCPLSDIPVGAERINLGGLTIAAGLVDAQVNGGGGVLFNDALSEDGVRKISTAHQQHGTTAFLPTLITNGMDKVRSAINLIRDLRQKKDATNYGVLGLHLEGPFLNPARSGIHEKSFIQKADADFLDNTDVQSLGTLLITLAPEMFEKGAIRKIHEKGAILAAGHSAANAEALKNAKAEGLNGITHLFNAMGGMSAREAGLSGLALDDNDLYCSIIADGAHVASEMLRLAYKAKPDGTLFFVSDAMPPAGSKTMNQFTLQDKTIYARDGKCVDDKGNLAGSALTLFECMRYAVQHAGFSLEKAHAMASLYPARFLKVDRDYGSLSVGCRADFIAFDSALKLEHVFIAGDTLSL